MKNIIMVIVLCFSFTSMAEIGADGKYTKETFYNDAGLFADLNIGYFTGEVGNTNYDGLGFGFHFGVHVKEKYYLGGFFNTMSGGDISSLSAGITGKYSITSQLNALVGYSLYSEAENDNTRSELSDSIGFFIGGEYLISSNWSVRLEYHKLTYDEGRDELSGVVATGVDIDSSYAYLAINWVI